MAYYAVLAQQRVLPARGLDDLHELGRHPRRVTPTGNTCRASRSRPARSGTGCRWRSAWRTRCVRAGRRRAARVRPHRRRRAERGLELGGDPARAAPHARQPDARWSSTTAEQRRRWARSRRKLARSAGTRETVDGHDHDALRDALAASRGRGRPRSSPTSRRVSGDRRRDAQATGEAVVDLLRRGPRVAVVLAEISTDYFRAGVRARPAPRGQRRDHGADDGRRRRGLRDRGVPADRAHDRAVPRRARRSSRSSSTSATRGSAASSSRLGASYDYTASPASRTIRPATCRRSRRVPADADPRARHGRPRLDALVRATYANGQPTYLRTSEGGERVVARARAGGLTSCSAGRDATVVAVGPMLDRTLAAVDGHGCDRALRDDVVPLDAATLAREAAPAADDRARRAALRGHDSRGRCPRRSHTARCGCSRSACPAASSSATERSRSTTATSASTCTGSANGSSGSYRSLRSLPGRPRWSPRRPRPRR